jgi:hypothetical protein
VLAGLSGNCALEGPPVQKVNVTLGARVEVAFAVRCLRLGALRVTIETSGVELDPDGYQVDMFSEGANFVTGQPLPAKSVKDVLFTFFTGKRIKVAGEEMSFNHLEKDVIRSKFSDPRVHFALNCASRSCPPLNPEAFRGDKLDAQLEKLAQSFVNSEKGVNYSADKKSADLSAIFEWYKDDFKGEGGPVAFINKRRETPLPNDTKSSYQKYDWSLNEAK